MSDHHKRRLMRVPGRRYRDSNVLLGTVMAGIAMLFIACIVAAFFYAKDTNPIQTAQHPATIASPPAASPPAPPAAREPATTGSSGIDSR